MGNLFKIKNTGEMLLHTFSANPSGSEGMVIYNSTDKKLRYYDGTQWVDSGGSSGGLYSTPWFFDETLFSVYDDFDSYSLGNFIPQVGTKWVVTRSDVTGNTYTDIITANPSSYEGGSGKALQLGCVAGLDNSTHWIQIDSGASFPTNKTAYWFRCSLPRGTPYASYIDFYLRINGTNYSVTTNRQGGGQQIGGSVDLGNPSWGSSQVLITKVGTTWDVYFGGIKIATGLNSITSIGFKQDLSFNGATSSGSLSFIIDDVRYYDGVNPNLSIMFGGTVNSNANTFWPSSLSSGSSFGQTTSVSCKVLATSSPLYNSGKNFFGVFYNSKGFEYPSVTRNLTADKTYTFNSYESPQSMGLVSVLYGDLKKLELTTDFTAEMRYSDTSGTGILNPVTEWSGLTDFGSSLANVFDSDWGTYITRTATTRMQNWVYKLSGITDSYGDAIRMCFNHNATGHSTWHAETYVWNFTTSSWTLIQNRWYGVDDTNCFRDIPTEDYVSGGVMYIYLQGYNDAVTNVTNYGYMLNFYKGWISAYASFPPANTYFGKDNSGLPTITEWGDAGDMCARANAGDGGYTQVGGMFKKPKHTCSPLFNTESVSWNSGGGVWASKYITIDTNGIVDFKWPTGGTPTGIKNQFGFCYPSIAKGSQVGVFGNSGSSGGSPAGTSDTFVVSCLYGDIDRLTQGVDFTASHRYSTTVDLTNPVSDFATWGSVGSITNMFDFNFSTYETVGGISVMEVYSCVKISGLPTIATGQAMRMGIKAYSSESGNGGSPGYGYCKLWNFTTSSWEVPTNMIVQNPYVSFYSSANYYVWVEDFITTNYISGGVMYIYGREHNQHGGSPHYTQFDWYEIQLYTGYIEPQD